MTISQRADAALAALGQHTGQAYRRAVPAPVEKGEIEEAMIDLVADLEHLAKREEISFVGVLSMARRHVIEERAGL